MWKGEEAEAVGAAWSPTAAAPAPAYAPVEHNLAVHAEEAGRAACTGTGESSLSVNLAVAPSIRGKGPKHPADDTYALFLPAPQHFSGKFCAKGSIAVEFSMSGLFILICCAWGQGRAG